MFRVVHEFDIEAADYDEAFGESMSIKAEPKAIRVRELTRPRATEGPGQHYEQPLEILDLAWDRFHDMDIRRITRAPGIEPTAMEERAVRIFLLGLDPVDVSILFDLAITAYRDAFEG